MLYKGQYPMLNRAARRHPKKFLDYGNGWLNTGNFLIAALLLRGGFVAQDPGGAVP